MKGRIGISKRLTCRRTETEQEVIRSSSSTKYTRLVFDSKVLFFFFSGSFQTTDSPPSVSGIEYFLFFVACLDNSVRWSSGEFKFCAEFLP